MKLRNLRNQHSRDCRVVSLMNKYTYILRILQDEYIFLETKRLFSLNRHNVILKLVRSRLISRDIPVTPSTFPKF